MTDGTARCWGTGYLGDGAETKRYRFEPAPVRDLAHVVEIAIGESHACARIDDGTVECWGDGTSGQVGDGTAMVHAMPVPARGILDAVQIAANGDQSCAVLRDHTVRCWGVTYDLMTDERHAPQPIAGLTDVTQVALGAAHACVVHAGGAVSCWGHRDYGVLGDGATSTTTGVPGRVAGLSGVAELALGQYHSCARTTAGTVRCWGANALGQLGDGTALAQRLTPSAVIGVKDATSLRAGYDHTCALLAGGGVKCWGSGSNGELGDGHGAMSRVAVDVAGLAGVVALGVGWSSSAAIVGDDRRLFWWGWHGAGPGDRARSADVLAPIELPIAGALQPVERRSPSSSSALAARNTDESTGGITSSVSRSPHSR